VINFRAPNRFFPEEANRLCLPSHQRLRYLSVDFTQLIVGLGLYAKVIKAGSCAPRRDGAPLGLLSCLLSDPYFLNLLDDCLSGLSVAALQSAKA
jgi:hypothetical protein